MGQRGVNTFGLVFGLSCVVRRLPSRWNAANEGTPHAVGRLDARATPKFEVHLLATYKLVSLLSNLCQT